MQFLHFGKMTVYSVWVAGVISICHSGKQLLRTLPGHRVSSCVASSRLQTPNTLSVCPITSFRSARAFISPKEYNDYLRKIWSEFCFVCLSFHYGFSLGPEGDKAGDARGQRHCYSNHAHHLVSHAWCVPATVLVTLLNLFQLACNVIIGH